MSECIRGNRYETISFSLIFILLTCLSNNERYNGISHSFASKRGIDLVSSNCILFGTNLSISG
ncbi:hypothetical protein X975_23946, partial [Stegodyphus mimosarum]